MGTSAMTWRLTSVSCRVGKANATLSLGFEALGRGGTHRPVRKCERRVPRMLVVDRYIEVQGNDLNSARGAAVYERVARIYAEALVSVRRRKGV